MKQVRSAKACWMLRIAFNLGWPSLVALDQQPNGRTAKRHRRGIEQGPPKHDLLRLPHVGQNVLARLARASCQTGKPECGSHHAQEIAAGGWILQVISA